MSNGEGGTDVVTAGDRVVTQPADRALAYGKTAAKQPVQAAQTPKKKPQKTPPAAEPEHVLKAKAQWKLLFPERKNVKIYDLTKAPSPVIAASTFDAWTNSATEIYVAQSAASSDNKCLATLYHESLHLDQFLKEHNKPPSTYDEMMKAELKAYGDSEKWLRNPDEIEQSADVKEMAAESHKISSAIQAKITAVEKDCNADLAAGVDAATVRRKREKEYRDFLLDFGQIPLEKRPMDPRVLYKP